MTEAVVEQLTSQARSDAIAAACLLAVAPEALRGLRLRARAGHHRDAYLDIAKALRSHAQASDQRWHRVPPQTTEDRLLGGLDLVATLAAGHPVFEPGILARAHGGCVVIPMAERLPVTTAARISHVLDSGEISADASARFTVVALDEGIDDERLPEALGDRLALHIELEPGPPFDEVDLDELRDRTVAARLLFAATVLDDATCDAIASVSLALDVRSARAMTFCHAAARAAAALDGVPMPTADHLALAIRLVLLPRARQIPQQAEQPPEPAPDTAPEPNPDTPPPDPNDQQTLDDVVLAAALARLPPDVLARLTGDARTRIAASAAARSGANETRAHHGRPAGVRPGDPTRGDRLDIVATLRTAAPWQALRQRRPGAPVVLQRSDFRVKRLVRPTGVTTIFLVDASGSSALHRLAEVKGAVELLLADCYVRRDHVALIAFRGKSAELLLPPTRALARAKRALAALPGGGGTPLASALVSAEAVVADVRRRGNRADIVVLTDGRANVDRNGRPGRAAAEADALLAAKSLRAKGIGTLVIDTSARPDPASGRLAEALGAAYLPLPYADARTLSSAVRAASASSSSGARV
jgi:magnesium chelatase subunit D